MSPGMDRDRKIFTGIFVHQCLAFILKEKKREPLVCLMTITSARQKIQNV